MGLPIDAMFGNQPRSLPSTKEMNARVVCVQSESKRKGRVNHSVGKSPRTQPKSNPQNLGWLRTHRDPVHLQLFAFISFFMCISMLCCCCLCNVYVVCTCKCTCWCIYTHVYVRPEVTVRFLLYFSFFFLLYFSTFVYETVSH